MRQCQQTNENEGAQMANYLAAATEVIPAFMTELEPWVMIDSGSDDKPGIDLLGALVQARFERSGFTVETYFQEHHGNHLLARRRGQAAAGKRLLLIGHLDTVYPRGAVALHPYAVRDGSAYGPGIFDMKSGVLAGITALDLAGVAALDRFASIAFICNSDEEIGSPTSTPLIRAEAATADVVLVLEPTRDPASVTVARKGIATYTLDVVGLSAHAGVAPESGRNAIAELSHIILALHAIHGSIPTVSVNVGAITGGGRRNVVPDHAQALFEMRAATAEAFEAGKAAVQAALAAPRLIPDTIATLTAGPEHRPLTLNDGARRMVTVAEAVWAAHGLALAPLSIGGASDGNTTGGMGRPTLDGLGLVGRQSHHPEEHIILEHIPLRLALLAELIEALAGAEL
jgi:glutamate carboxypeptidase